MPVCTIREFGISVKTKGAAMKQSNSFTHQANLGLYNKGLEEVISLANAIETPVSLIIF
jgi:hypothetical protein